MSGKFSANVEDLEIYLERKLILEEAASQNSIMAVVFAPKEILYHLDKETVEILNEDRINTGG
jgi:hypothetical protein